MMNGHIAEIPVQQRGIRVVIGDTDESFRETLRDAFTEEPSLEIVGQTADGVEALALLRSVRPDVALLHEDLPSFGGGAIARILRSELPNCRIVVLRAGGS